MRVKELDRICSCIQQRDQEEEAGIALDFSTSTLNVETEGAIL